MIVKAVIVDGPVGPTALEALAVRTGGAVGATLRFEGIVRRSEPDGGAVRELVALDYQTYDPMAQRELESLARSVAERHGLASIVAVHSRGRVGVGEVSFVLEVCAAHRAETLSAVTEFIDLLKKDVPIWKRPVWAR